MILCSRCLGYTLGYGHRPFDITPRHDVGTICEGCRAAVYVAHFRPMGAGGLASIWRWLPRPVMEVMADAVRTPV